MRITTIVVEGEHKSGSEYIEQMPEAELGIPVDQIICLDESLLSCEEVLL